MSDKKKKTGKFSKDKGARAEREIATKISKELGQDIKRKLGASREGGSDIEIESSSYFDKNRVLRTHPGWSIEVKNHKKLALDAWWAQTETQASKEGRRPVLMYKKHKEGWFCLYYFEGSPVLTDFETWVALYKGNEI